MALSGLAQEIKKRKKLQAASRKLQA